MTADTLGGGNTPFLLQTWGRGMLYTAGREKTPFCFKFESDARRAWGASGTHVGPPPMRGGGRHVFVRPQKGGFPSASL